MIRLLALLAIGYLMLWVVRRALVESAKQEARRRPERKIPRKRSQPIEPMVCATCGTPFDPTTTEGHCPHCER